jgi:hypothetical protein
MARKSKGFSELLNQQQTKVQQKSMAKLAKRVQQNFEGKVEIAPQNGIRMSDVLEAFIEPYLETAHTHDQRLMLLSIAAFAWNVALRPEDQQQQEITEFVSQIVPDANNPARQDITAILEEFVERKRSSFADVRRYIVDFELRETRNDVHLSVVSAPVAEDAS